MAARPTLYALYVPGPNELWPMENKDAAFEAMREHNAIIEKSGLPQRVGMTLEQVASHVVEWLYSVRLHRQLMRDGESFDVFDPIDPSEFIDLQEPESRCEFTVDMFETARTDESSMTSERKK